MEFRKVFSLLLLLGAGWLISSATHSAELGGIISIEAGGDHNCALTTGGGVKCWGNNFFGQIGDNSTKDRLTPVDVPGLTAGVKAIAANEYHTCVLTAAGGVKCWGNNFYGQLGDNSTADHLTPVSVTGLASGVVAIAAGMYQTCALDSAGAVKCWGNNDYGQMGDNSTASRLTPVSVTGLASGVAAIAAGGYHTCALTIAGGVKCWGKNLNGQLGDNTVIGRLTPVDVTGLTSGVTAISAGLEHNCARTVSGGVMCWGYNNKGQLGDGSTTQRLAPVEVTGLASGVTGIAGGFLHTCAQNAVGGAKCWGDNQYGQIGDNSTTNRLTPTDPAGISSGSALVAAGNHHTCALTLGGGVKCWGENSSGQIGDGALVSRKTPVQVVMPNAVPGAPIINSVTAGPGSANVSFAAPANAVGNYISGYIVNCTASGQAVKSAFGVGSPIEVPGLTAGNAYSCSVQAQNGLGDGPFSVALSVTPLPETFALSITTSGSGSVTSNPDGIDCGAVCSYNFANGALVALTATPAPGNSFLGWGGGCTGTANCSVRMDAVKSVSAGFNSDVPGAPTINAATAGLGSASISFTPSTHNTGGLVNEYTVTCTATGQVTQSTTGSGSPVKVEGMSGNIAYSCSVSASNSAGVSPASAALSVTPVPVSFVLGVTLSGSGLVASAPEGIECGTACSFSFSNGGLVVLTAFPADGNSFLSWSGACTGTATCSVRMDAAKTVTASFNSNVPGAPTIDSVIAGIVSASVNFTPSTHSTGGLVNEYTATCTSAGQVTQSATSLTSPVKVGGLTDGVAYSCTVMAANSAGISPISAAIAVTPAPASFVLGVSLAGTGAVVSAPEGIECGATCSSSFANGDLVTLTAVAAEGSFFTGWSGACSGSGSCAVKIDAAKNVTAKFVSLQSGGSPVVEFYNTTLDNYFITADPFEAAAIDNGAAGPGWSRTGETFKSGGSTPVCRFYGSYSPGPNSHFYTVLPSECQGLKDIQFSVGDPRRLTVKAWNFESLDFISTPPSEGKCPDGMVPVYRAYNNGFSRGVDSNHRISSNLAAIQQVVARGWSNENVVMCAPN